ncbi:MAG: DUF736 domain-containing protein [Proteobacteria bacterium]|nr:DUF736 domain-containing protein [Pseudomonadota bacterium]
MPILGFFRREGDGFAGRLTTLSLDVAVRLAPTGKVSGKGPDYRALVEENEIGAAWRAGDASGAVLNVKLDDPAWPEPVNARLLAAEDGVLPLTWIRQIDKTAAPATPPPPPD